MTLLGTLRRIADRTLPQGAVLSMWALAGHFKPVQRSYSQKGEDLLLQQYFLSTGLKQGSYCDIGCFHPVWISNTHLLHKSGWSGFAIDIDDFKLRSMSFARGDRVKCIRGAVRGKADEGDKATVYKFASRGWSDIDTLDKATAESYRLNGAGDYVESEVDLIDINRLFASLPHINFVNIDIEGLDKEVVLALDLAKYRPDVILFEDDESWGGSESVTSKLVSAGYQRLFISGGSVCYALPPPR